jgi:hypothetical protein
LCWNHRITVPFHNLTWQQPKKADKGDAVPTSKKAVSGQKIADKSDGTADSKKAAGEVSLSFNYTDAH